MEHADAVVTKVRIGGGSDTAMPPSVFLYLHTGITMRIVVTMAGSSPLTPAHRADQPHRAGMLLLAACFVGTATAATGQACAANYNSTKPCCGQDPHEKHPVPVADRCPAGSPKCCSYVYGSHLGACVKSGSVCPPPPPPPRPPARARGSQWTWSGWPAGPARSSRAASRISCRPAP